MRARLMQRFIARFARLDYDATNTLASDSHVASLAEILGDVPIEDGQDKRVEQETLDLTVQMEPDSHRIMELISAGMVSENHLEVTTLRRHLDGHGLIDAAGNILLGKGDRLSGIYTTAGEVVWEPPAMPGLYVESVRRRGWGISIRRPRADLVTIVLGDRTLQPERTAS